MPMYQPDNITHYFRRGTPPFRSLSSLSDNKAVDIMKSLYDETLFGRRFKDPAQYLQNRRLIRKKGKRGIHIKGRPADFGLPYLFCVGKSRWLIEHSPDSSLHMEIQICLSDFEEEDVSFTYPDSMISFRFGNEKPVDFSLPEFHGKVFTRNEILSIVKSKGIQKRIGKQTFHPYWRPILRHKSGTQIHYWNTQIMADPVIVELF